MSDLVLAARLVRKQPVLSLTAVLALATGIGLATLGFTFLEAGLRARLPFMGGDRFVMLEAYEDPHGRRATLSRDRFQALRDGTPALRHLGALGAGSQNLLLPSDEVALVSGVSITPDSFAVLPFAPLVGRVLNAADAAPGAPPVVVIRESLWRRHFSGDVAAVGRTANFSGVHREIVGVMPDALEFPTSPELWLPLGDPSQARVFGVLAHEDGLGAAQAQVTAVSQQFEQERTADPKLRLQVSPYVEALSRGLDVLAGSLVFVLVLVLLVIAANVANLVLARSLARSSELAIRSALGASRARLVGQVFVEVLLLGCIAAVIGVYASEVTLRWIRDTMTEMPSWVNLTAGPRTAFFVVVITVLAAAVGGAWPALRATRRDTQQALAAASRRVAVGFGATSSAMIVLQVALSIGALHTALVVARGVAGYMQGAATPGEAHVLTARLYLPEPLEPSGAHAAVLDALRQIPGIEHAGLGTSLPRLSPQAIMTTVRVGATAEASAPRSAPVVAISPGFVETLGGRATAGRLFTAADYAGTGPPIAIVNEPFAAKFFGGGNPVGYQLRFLNADERGASPEWREIVGVVPDLGLSAGDEQLAGGVYVPLRNETLIYATAVVAGDPLAMSMTLRRAVAAADPRIQVRETQPLPEVGKEDRAVFAGIGAALTALGSIALVLSVIGVYALLSFSVTARTRELAVRSALGASRVQLLRTVLIRAALPLVIGAAIGPVVSTALVAVRGIFAFRLPSEAGTVPVALLCGVLALSALAAAWVPSRRALRISIADALKADT